MPAAIPFIPAIVSTVGGMFGNRQTDAEKQMGAVAQQQSQLARMMQDIAGKQFTMSQPALQQALRYYSTLAGAGGRAGINQMLAPQIGQVTDYYRGAERGLSARMAPGPQRDRAIADLYRQKAGQLGMMPMQARAGANQALAGLGESINSQALSGLGGAAGVLSGQAGTLGGIAGMERQRQQNWMNFGEAIAPMWLQGFQNSGMFGGGRKPLQGRSTVGNIGFLPGSF